jgi:1,2-phenylacetyl-CoA epoxidase catalytic subunit
MMSGFLSHPDRRVAALARKIGEESYFHLKYATGWFAVLADEIGARGSLEEAFAERLPLALDWFGPGDAEDALHLAGERTATPEELRDSFLVDVTEEIKACGIVATADVGRPVGEWRPVARRRGPLSESLFEVIRFKDPGLAH